MSDRTAPSDWFARVYEYCQAAAERGESLAACPCRRANRRYACAAEWHAVNDRRLRLAREARLATPRASFRKERSRAKGPAMGLSPPRRDPAWRVRPYDRAEQKVRLRRVEKKYLLQRFGAKAFRKVTSTRALREEGRVKTWDRRVPATQAAGSRHSQPIKEEAHAYHLPP